MTEPTPEIGSTYSLQKSAFNQLIGSLQSMGYQTVGPVVQGDAITYAPIQGLQDLPKALPANRMPVGTG